MKLKSIFKKKSKETSNPIPQAANLGISTPASPTSPPPITHPSAEQQAYTNDDSINETVVTDAAIKDSRSTTNVNDGYRKSRKASNATSDDYKPRDNDRRYEKKPSSSSDDQKRERKKGNREKGSERSSSTREKGDRERKKGRDKGSERKSDRKKGRERGGEERKSRKNSKFYLCLVYCMLRSLYVFGMLQLFFG